MPDLAVGLAAAPLDVEDVVDLLEEHRDAFHPVGDLTRDRRQVHAAHLLKIGELRDLGAVEHHLPTDAPRAKRRRLPVVFFEADVVLARIDTHRLEAVEIDLQHFVGRRLEDHLQLMMLEQAIRVLAEPSVVRAGATAGCRRRSTASDRARATAFPDARCRRRLRRRAAAESGSLAPTRNAGA